MNIVKTTENRILGIPNIGQVVKRPGRRLGWNGEQEGKTGENRTWGLRSGELVKKLSLVI